MQAQIGVDIVEPTAGSHTFSTLTASRSAFRLGLGTAFNSAYVLNISGAADTIGGIAVQAWAVIPVISPVARFTPPAWSN